MAAPSADPPCGLCGASAAPYTCPRCNRRLCSLRCYRGHGACAEAFYRRQVLEALEAEPGPPGLDAAFRRVQRLGEAGDAERPAGCDLWKSLNPAERAEFRRLLSSGEVAALLPPWRPWWWRRRGKKKEEEEDEEEEEAAPPPPLPAALPPLSAFPAPPPSPLLPFQLLNVLYGYAFALALHRGDESLLPELPAAAIDVSAALRSRCPFPDAAAAIGAARRDAAAAGYPPCPLGDTGTVLAVAELLEGSVAGGGPGGDAGAALAHLGGLLRRGERGLHGRDREPFRRARKKCLFLLVWARQEPPPALEGLGRVVRGLVSGSGNELISGEGNELVSGDSNEGTRGRRLIEELD